MSNPAKSIRIGTMDGNWATGDWNIAHNPDAWELMFNETPDDNIGLEWEPCHQLVYLIDPMSDPTLQAAAGLLGILPTVIFFLIFQRTLTRGVVAGAVK